ncbi:phosphoglycerate kinase [candidate division TA06 bacterium]|uniref:Phosphoglycerate kinase n=1 Tax=candidate division TA06 bacterium TaxID=2250710 RepID=A0A660SR33_UNCT6|nr:MAG: phosphoglycerate kinase [candidate division TA06 bacterium]
MNVLTIDKYKNYSNKRVLIRCDFNVPLKRSGEIEDSTRITKTLETINYLLDMGAAKVILMSHLGEPGGKRDESLSLKPVKDKLEKLLKQEITFIEDITEEKSINISKDKTSNRIILLENLRFYPGETKDNKKFAKILSKYADIYINEAFSVSHRKHASVHAIGEFIDLKIAGFQMEKEITYFNKYINDPKRPFVAIIGGAKISSKIDVMINLINKVDQMIIGGAMAFTFLKSQGIDIGKSLFEKSKLDLAEKIIKKAGQSEVMLLLPEDVVIANNIDKPGKMKTVEIHKIPDNKMGMDIGEATIKKYKSALIGAKTIIWNGPMGVFENDEFKTGTYEIAKAIAKESKKGAISIVGGGDTISAVNKFKMTKKFNHISTGGGASLDFMSGKSMPGIEILIRK